jgi:hypothetical protein
MSERRVRSNEPFTKDRFLGISTQSVRSVYRFAEEREDGSYAGGGYAPGDMIGHQIINTVRGLCDKVDYLERVIVDIAFALPSSRSEVWEGDDMYDSLVAIREILIEDVGFKDNR